MGLNFNPFGHLVPPRKTQAVDLRLDRTRSALILFFLTATTGEWSRLAA